MNSKTVKRLRKEAIVQAELHNIPLKTTYAFKDKSRKTVTLGPCLRRLIKEMKTKVKGGPNG